MAHRHSPFNDFTGLPERIPYLFPGIFISTGAFDQFPTHLGDSLAKFMLSLRDENFKLLVDESEDRGISVQELIRAVIIPDWVKVNTMARSSTNPAIRALIPASEREQLLQPMGKLRA